MSRSFKHSLFYAWCGTFHSEKENKRLAHRTFRRQADSKLKRATMENRYDDFSLTSKLEEARKGNVYCFKKDGTKHYGGIKSKQEYPELYRK